MEITEQQFNDNIMALSDDEKGMVLEVLEAHSEETLEIFASALGVTISMDETLEEPIDETLEEPIEEEVVEELPEEDVVPTDEVLPLDQEMQELAFGAEVQPAQASELPVDSGALEAEMAGLIQQEGASETGVADDVQVDEAEAGDYIINAAAVKRVGVQDLEERILEPAIERLNKRGIDITLASLKSPSDQIQNVDDSENVDIAISNGEYYIPEVLAAEIGYDLLDKINKRGEKETEEKLAEAAPAEEAAPVEAPAEQAMLQGFNSGSPGGVKKKVDNLKIKKKIRILENAPLEKEKDNLKKQFIAKKLGGEKFKTLGFGHSLKNKKNSIKIFQKLWPKANAKAIAEGKEGITKEQALQLFDHDFAEKEKDVMRYVGQDRYLNLPEVARSAFLNAHFRGDFHSKSGKRYKWVNLVLDEDYLAASEEILDHKEYKKPTTLPGIKKRLEDISSNLANFGIERTTHFEDLSSIPDTPSPTQDQSFMDRDIEETSSIRPLGTEPITGEDRGQLSLRDARDISKINEGIGTSA